MQMIINLILNNRGICWPLDNFFCDIKVLVNLSAVCTFPLNLKAISWAWFAASGCQNRRLKLWATGERWAWVHVKIFCLLAPKLPHLHTHRCAPVQDSLSCRTEMLFPSLILASQRGYNVMIARIWPKASDLIRVMIFI